MMPALPAGYSARPATLADFPAITELQGACNRALIGIDDTSLADVRLHWTLPCIDLAQDSQLIFTADGTLAAAGLVTAQYPVQIRLECHVHPAHRRRGLGTGLLAWGDARGQGIVPRAPADARVVLWSSAFEQDTAAAELLAHAGYAEIRRFYRYSAPLADPPPADFPPDFTIRTLDLDRDEVPVYRAIHDVFRDHWGFVERDEADGVAELRHWLTQSPGSDPAFNWLAFAGDDLAGFCLCQSSFAGEDDRAYVGSLGVVRDYRRRGLGAALLRHAAVEFARRGNRHLTLHADATNLTGANRVYERAGMQPDRRAVIREKQLRPGRSLRKE
jgi:mycothiol synthase